MKKNVVRILFVISTLLVLIAFTFWTYNFLSAHHPVDSNNFLIEAWVPSYDVEEAVQTINQDNNAQVYIVGKNYNSDKQPNTISEFVKPGEPIILAANGSILITPEENILNDQTDSLSLILILKGSKARDIFSHVSIAVNRKYIQSFFTSDKQEEYQVIIPAKKLALISISFDNDLYTENEDRNLFLYDVFLGENKINFSEQHVSIERNFTKRNTGFLSSTDHMANYISDLGVDQSKIHSISFNESDRNQTLNGAVAFSKFNETEKLTSFNVISSGIHSRRTWKTYQKLFNGKADVGVYYFSPVGFNETNWYKSPQGYLQLYEEFFSLVANLLYSKT